MTVVEWLVRAANGGEGEGEGGGGGWDLNLFKKIYSLKCKCSYFYHWLVL